MNETKEVKLNLGAGQTYIPGFVNVDLSSRADVSLDLGKDKLPFEDDSVDVIFSYHTLEHVPDYLFALSQIYRVLKHGGRLLLGLPYVTLTKYHLVNPYHLHNFNEYSFDFFDQSLLKGSAVETNAISFRKVFHRFHYVSPFNLVPPPFRSWCRRHLLNVVRSIDYGLVAVKRPNGTVPTSSEGELIRQFDHCLNSRISYDNNSPLAASA